MGRLRDVLEAFLGRTSARGGTVSCVYSAARVMITYGQVLGLEGDPALERRMRAGILGRDG